MQVRRLYFTIGILLLPLCSWGALVSEADVAFAKGNYPRAIASWMRLAKQNQVSAQFNLGRVFDIGAGVTTNSREAAKWYLLAASGGNPRAQYHLARLYHRGQGLDKDLTQAMIWYQRAAALGLSEAQFNLGVM